MTEKQISTCPSQPHSRTWIRDSGQNVQDYSDPAFQDAQSKKAHAKEQADETRALLGNKPPTKVRGISID